MINLYCNNPTAGKTDGTLVSQNMAQTSPLSITLKVGESRAAKVALRTGEGYKCDGATVSVAYWNGTEYKNNGGNTDRWSIAQDNGYASDTEALNNATWKKGSCEITGEITSTANKVFWIKVDTAEGDEPINDTSISICVKATIEAV